LVTVTFLFTDIEGSTRLWETDPEGMRRAVAGHDRTLRTVIESHGGLVFSTGGDGFGAAFSRAGDAVAAAVEAQGALGEESLVEGGTLRVRMGLHAGEVEQRDGDYFGTEVNRAARLMAVAHGGQTVCSATVADLVGADLPAGVFPLTNLIAAIESGDSEVLAGAVRLLAGRNFRRDRKDDLLALPPVLRGILLANALHSGGEDKIALARQASR
jgi:class 3 adenylate cyclase